MQTAVCSIDEQLAIRNLIARNKELEEYKKIAELTKVSCCTAQNCEALNNAIREGLENTKLKEKIEKLESALDNSVSKDEINEVFETIKKQAIPKYKKMRELENTIGMSMEEYDELRVLWVEIRIFNEIIGIIQELLNKGE